MDSVDFDKNIPLMEEYDPVTWPILAMISPNSLDFLDRMLASDEAFLEFINIWLHPPKYIFCGATGSIFGLNPTKYRSILCMFLDIIRYIWKHVYKLGYPSVKMHLNLLQSKISIGPNLLEIGGSTDSFGR